MASYSRPTLLYLAEKFNATLIGLSALAVHPPFLIEGVAIQQATEADIVEIMAMLTAKGDWFQHLNNIIGGSSVLRMEPQPRTLMSIKTPFDPRSYLIEAQRADQRRAYVLRITYGVY
jgi:hypothetical protein